MANVNGNAERSGIIKQRHRELRVSAIKNLIDRLVGRSVASDVFIRLRCGDKIIPHEPACLGI